MAIDIHGFGLRKEWINSFSRMVENDPFFSKEDLAAKMGLGTKQVPSFLAWMKDLHFISRSGNGFVATEKFSQFFKEDPAFFQEKTWYKIILRFARPDSNIQILSWYLNSFPHGEKVPLDKLVEMFLPVVGERYSLRTIKNGVASIRDFFVRTPLGNNLGFFVFQNRLVEKDPKLPDATLFRELCQEKWKEENVPKENQNIENESEPGGIVRVFGLQSRPLFLSEFL